MINTEGIVIRNFKVKEQDNILHILTKDFGKLRVYVNKARNPKSKFISSTQLFLNANFEIDMLEKLHRLNDFEIIEVKNNLLNDLDKFFYGNYILELLDLSIKEQEKDSNLYETVKYSLINLNELNNSYLKIFKLFFEFKLLILQGYHIILDNCIYCNDNKNLLLCISIEGGILCENCYKNLKNSKKLFNISLESFKILNLLLKKSFSSVQKLDINAIIIKELSNLSYIFIRENLIHKELNTLKMLM